MRTSYFKWATFLYFISACPHSSFSQQIISFSTKEMTPMENKGDKELLKPRLEVSVVGNKAFISYNVQNAELREISINRTNYSFIHIKGFGYDVELGKPQLPGYTDMIPVNSTTPNLHLTTSSYVEYQNIKVIPSQKGSLDDIPEEGNLVINDTVYSTDDFFPREIVKIQDIQDYRGQKYAFVRVNPVQYNPASGVIRCHQNIRYIIDGINKELLTATVNRDSNTPTISTKQEKFIIVTSDDYLSSISDFVSWKKDIGFHVSIISKNQWTDENEVRDSIRGEYYKNASTLDPRYVLIVGGYSSVPAKKYIFPISSYTPSYVSDHYFSCMGDSTDYLADIARGRIPLEDADSIRSFFSFLIQKEKSPTFWGKGIHSAYFNSLSDHITEKQNCVSFSEDTRDYMMQHGFGIERVYKKSSSTNPLLYSKLYASGDSVPAELRVGNFAWNGSANDIKNAFNNGCDYIMYKGHGDIDGLTQIGFTRTSLYGIHDNVCSPLFLCFACLCGQYASLDWNTGEFEDEWQCFTKSLLKYKKSCGVIASSGKSYAPYLEPFGEGFFSSLYNDSILSPSMHSLNEVITYNQIHEINQEPKAELGNMMNYGFLKMLESFGTNEDAIEEQTHYHVFGDPSFQFPIGSPVNLNNIEINRVNSDILVDTHGIDSCTIILEQITDDDSILSYKRLENVTGNYSFTDETDYIFIIIKKNNCKTVFLNGFSSVYLQNRNILANQKYTGDNIAAGRNVTNSTSIGDVVVKNGGSLSLIHKNKTILEKGFKVEAGGKLTIKKQ